MNCPDCGAPMLYSGETDEAEIWYCEECNQDIPVIDINQDDLAEEEHGARDAILQTTTT